jgi:hypothetical protein
MNLNSHLWESKGVFKATVWVTCVGIFELTMATFAVLQIFLR